MGNVTAVNLSMLFIVTPGSQRRELGALPESWPRYRSVLENQVAKYQARTNSQPALRKKRLPEFFKPHRSDPASNFADHERTSENQEVKL